MKATNFTNPVREIRGAGLRQSFGRQTGVAAEASAKTGMLVEKLEHIRHAAPDDPAVIQTGQRLVLNLAVQVPELISQLL